MISDEQDKAYQAAERVFTQMMSEGTPSPNMAAVFYLRAIAFFLRELVSVR